MIKLTDLLKPNRSLKLIDILKESPVVLNKDDMEKLHKGKSVEKDGHEISFVTEDEEGGKDVSLKVKKDIGLVFDNEQDRDQVLNMLQDISIYPQDVSTQATRGKKEIEAHLEKVFGPSNAAKRRSLEKQRGEPFPIRTKDAITQAIKDFSKAKAPILFEPKDSTAIVFPQEKNTSLGFKKDRLLKIVKHIAKQIPSEIYHEITEFTGDVEL